MVSMKVIILHSIKVIIELNMDDDNQKMDQIQTVLLDDGNQ